MHFCFLKFLVDGELRFKKKKKKFDVLDDKFSRKFGAKSK